MPSTHNQGRAIISVSESSTLKKQYESTSLAILNKNVTRCLLTAVVDLLLTGLAFLLAVLESCIMLLFGLAFYLDRGWLPMYYLNFLSWSYGLAIVSAFFSIFAAISQVTHIPICQLLAAYLFIVIFI